MKTVLIISEYNPFHLGHKYQIDDIRKTYGEDTNIIALMSGSFTQRGETAISDKFTRAKCATLAGVNLVLLLPFPYCASSAEFFARAGVSIANSLGIVDVLAFGSECGDLELLSEVAKNFLSDEFLDKLEFIKNDESYKTLGYPKICEMIYLELFGKKIDENFFSSNNILAIEYLKALAATKSKIIPYTTKRCGAGYNSVDISKSGFQSATAIRKLFCENIDSAFEYIPVSSKEVLTITSTFGASSKILLIQILLLYDVQISASVTPVQLFSGKF